MPLQPVPCIWVGGQSNAKGQGLLEDLTAAEKGPIPNYFISGNSFPDIKQYDPGVNSNAHSGAAKIPKKLEPKFGPEFTLGKRILQTESELYLLKTPIGGTNLHRQWASNGFAWLYTRDSYFTFVELLAAQGLTPDWKLIVWDQGESDMSNSNRANRYKKNIEQLEIRIRSLFNAPNTPMVCVRPYYRGTNKSINVRQAIIRFCNESPLRAWCNIDDLTSHDGIHRDSAGIKEEGERILTLYDSFAIQA